MLNILKIWPLMLYDVSDFLFWCFRVTGLGLTLSFCVVQKKRKNKEKKSANKWGCFAKIANALLWSSCSFFLLSFEL